MDYEGVEGGVEEVGPECPAVVGDVVVAHHGEEGEHNLVAIKLLAVLFAAVHEVVDPVEVLIDVHIFECLDSVGQVDVVFGLGVGDVAEVCPEHIVVVEAVLEVFCHTHSVGSDVAIGADEE